MSVALPFSIEGLVALGMVGLALICIAVLLDIDDDRRYSA